MNSYITVKDCVLPGKARRLLERNISTGECPHLLLVGPRGRGETFARSICNELDADVLEIECSYHTEPKEISEVVEQFMYRTSLFGRPKVLVVHEFCSLLPQLQRMFNVPMEDGNAAVIFTAKSLEEITGGIKSRCYEVDLRSNDFDIIDDRTTEKLWAEFLIDNVENEHMKTMLRENNSMCRQVNVPHIVELIIAKVRNTGVCARGQKGYDLEDGTEVKTATSGWDKDSDGVKSGRVLIDNVLGKTGDVYAVLCNHIGNRMHYMIIPNDQIPVLADKKGRMRIGILKSGQLAERYRQFEVPSVKSFYYHRLAC